MSSSSPQPARRRIMVYCPEAFVRPHFIFLQFIGRILQDFGHEVFSSYCNRLFPRCVSKESVVMPPGAPPAFGEQVCELCVKSFTELVQHADIPNVAIHQAVQPEVIERLKQVIADTPDAMLPDFMHDGINFGKLCFADLLVGQKLMLETPLEPQHYAYLREYLVTTLASYIGMVEFLPAAGFTDVLIYGEYAGNVCVAYAAERTGLRWKMLHTIGHMGFDRRRFYIAQSEIDGWKSVILDSWPEWRDTPLRDDEIVEVANDVVWRLGSLGIATYSPAKTQDSDIYAALGLSRDRPVVLACTSSLDECNSFMVRGATRGGAPPPIAEQPFPDQTQWLGFLLRAFSARPDVQLVIRIHPREDANKRESVRSRHLDLLREQFRDLPPNVKVIWPADPISSYDVLEVSRLALVWMSTVGLEAARLGVPVVRAERGFPNYPVTDFAFSATNPTDYMKLVDAALDWAPNFTALVHAWRFYAYSRFFCSFDARDAAPMVEMETLPPYRRPASAPSIVEAVLGNADAWDATRARPGFLDGRSDESEARAIRSQVRKLFHTLMTGAKPDGDISLAIGEGSAPENDTVCIVDGWCTYAHGGRRYSRFSPMCERLAILGTG